MSSPHDTRTALATFAAEVLPGSQPVDDPVLPSHLLRIRGADGRDYIAKMHQKQARFRREHHAYRTWTAAIREWAPQLISADPVQRMLLTTALPGTPVSKARLSTDREMAVHRNAGRLLRRLHDAEPLRRDSQIGPYLAGRLRYWIRQGHGLLCPADRRKLLNFADAISNAGPVEVGVCHLDFQPHNWVAHRRMVGLIDFEHTRIDVRIRDLCRLAFRHWEESPDLRHAFLTGYGRQLTDSENHLLHLFGAIEAATSIVRGHHTDAPELLNHGRTLLTRLDQSA